ncbi:MAG: hypothetical protein FJ102_18550 [Deltaproteobacteria bacterium]|nr:hypothetical protein [Deltaproteobacteria bacterium]
MLRPLLGLALFASLACGGIPGLPSTSSEPPPPPGPPAGSPAAAQSPVDRYIADCAYAATATAPGGTAVPACDNVAVDSAGVVDAGGCGAKRARCQSACPGECRAAETACTGQCTDCRAKCGTGADAGSGELAGACVRACAESRTACAAGSWATLGNCDGSCDGEYQACVSAVQARAARECDTDCDLIRDCATGARPSGSEACNAVHRRASQFCQDACRP